jgi:hypothetical protein
MPGRLEESKGPLPLCLEANSTLRFLSGLKDFYLNNLD